MSGHFYKSPYLVKSARLARQHVTRLIGTADSPLLGPNPRRKGLILCAPAAERSPTRNASLALFAGDASTTGNKLTYTVPAGVEADVTGFSAYVRSGTPALGLLLGVGGVSALVQVSTSSFTVPIVLPLRPGDAVVGFVNVGGGAGALADFFIGVREQRVQDRYTVGFAGPAVLDAGLTVYPGRDPVCILQGEVAQSLTEEVRAISANVAQSVTVIELFDFYEELPRGRHP